MKIKHSNRAARRVAQNYNNISLPVEKTSVRKLSNNSGKLKATSSGYKQTNNPKAMSGKANKEYFALIVQSTNNVWWYVKTRGSALETTRDAYVFELDQEYNLKELWKRVVIDNAIPWEDDINHHTLRIIRHNHKIADNTLEVLGDVNQTNELIKRVAVSKLSNLEAKLLGVDTDKTLQVIMANPEFDIKDQKNLQTLGDNCIDLSLDSILQTIF